MRDLSLHLMDIIQNSVSAGAAKITVSVYTDSEKDELVFGVADNGEGMDKELLERVINPFYTTRTTRKVGLGIPLLKSSAEAASGKLWIDSEKGKGTLLKASFRISHIDRLPLGDIADTIVSVIIAHPEIEFELLLSSRNGNFVFDTGEVKAKLGDVPIGQYEVIAWIREFVNEGVKFTFGGVLNEVFG